MRQGLGYKFQRQAQRLADFVSFMEKRKAVTITTKLALKWATLPPRPQRSMGVEADGRAWLRTSCREPQSKDRGAAYWHLATLEGGDAVCLKRRGDRRVAGRRACSAASKWTAAMDLPLFVWALAVTGMRLSEVIGLQRDDVDLKQGVLTVRQSKFGKS